jgi:hypothetical protein
MHRIKEINAETRSVLSQSMFTSLNVPGEDERLSAFKGAIVSHYANLMARKRFEVAEAEARRSWTFGKMFQ